MTKPRLITRVCVLVLLICLFLVVSPAYSIEYRVFSKIDSEPISHIMVLMYHVIDDVEGSSNENFVSPEIFVSQMEYLAERGYTTVTLKDVYENWLNNKRLPPKPIVLTFDDGYQSVFTHAYPVMKQYGFRGVLFIYVQKFDYANSLSKDEVTELISQGFEVGSHSYTHCELIGLGQERLEKEIIQAKQELEGMFDVSITSFAYPSGRYNEQIIELLKSSGYTMGVTTKYGYSRPEQGLLTLHRVRITRSDELIGFKRKIRNYEASFMP